MKPVPDLRLRRYSLWGFLALLVYTISFALPFDERMQGWQVFLLGLCGFLTPQGWPWLANPFLWFACAVAGDSRRRAFFLAFLAFVFALAYLLLFIIDSRARSVPGPAYWCWVGSMTIAVMGSGWEAFAAVPDTPGNEASTRWQETTGAVIASAETSSEEYRRGPSA